jgi:hypothetical protein
VPTNDGLADAAVGADQTELEMSGQLAQVIAESLEQPGQVLLGRVQRVTDRLE